MKNHEMTITQIQPQTMAPQEANKLAVLIERAYNPDFNPENEAKLDVRQFDNALSGVIHAEHILVGQEAGNPTAILGISVYTREKNPDFYEALATKIGAIEDDSLRGSVSELMNQIDALAYTHEMVTLRRGRGDIAMLRQKALEEEGFDIYNSRIALFGEFQGIDSIGVQRKLPNSVSLLAGVHIPQRGKDTVLDEETVVPLKTLTNIVGETFLMLYHPQTIVHETGAVQSQVFDVPPRRSRHMSHPSEFKATRVIEDLQRRLGETGFASAIGATYVNIVTTS